MVGDSSDDIQSYINEIINVLSEDSEKPVSREELEKEFRKFLEYGVPAEHAKQTLLKKFSGVVKAKVLAPTERTLIVDLQPNLSTVHLLCRVINVNPKEVTARGEKKAIFYGILGDETGNVSFTAWKDFNLTKGDVVEIKNAYTRTWQDTVQLNFGDRTTIEKTDESKLPERSVQPKEYKLKDLHAGVAGSEVTVKVLEFSKRQVDVENTKKNVFSGMIGDETGKAQFTAWHDFGLKQGDVIKITGGYVKTWKGVPQLVFDEKATVEKLQTDTISKKDIKTQKLPLYELVEKRGALDVEVEGTVIEIRAGSGLVLRCPECNRVIQNETCMTHGSVKGVVDLRIKIILDDGTGSVTSSLGRELVEELFGKTLSEWKKLAGPGNDNTALFQEFHNTLFAHRLSIIGNALGDQYGTTFIAKKAKLVDLDITHEVEQLMAEIEEMR